MDSYPCWQPSLVRSYCLRSSLVKRWVTVIFNVQIESSAINFLQADGSCCVACIERFLVVKWIHLSTRSLFDCHLCHCLVLQKVPSQWRASDRFLLETLSLPLSLSRFSVHYCHSMRRMIFKILTLVICLLRMLFRKSTSLIRWREKIHCSLQRPKSPRKWPAEMTSIISIKFITLPSCRRRRWRAIGATTRLPCESQLSSNEPKL